MRVPFAAAIALALAGPAQAETLQEAMAQAVASNPTLAAERARANAVRQNLPIARSEARPQLVGTGSATRSERDGGGGGGFVTPTGEVVGGGGETIVTEVWNGDVSASQLLFAGGRVAATVRRARAEAASAEARFNATLQALLVDVTAAFAEVRRARAAVAAREQSVANLTEQRRFAEARFEAGELTRTDVAQAQARLAQSQAQLVQAQGQLAAATETYARLVGAPPGDLPAPDAPGDLPANVEIALSAAQTQSPALVAAIAAETAAEAAYDAAKAGGRARVSLEAGTGLFGDFEGSEETTTESVGLRFSVPFYRGGLVRAQTRQERALHTAARFDRADAERAVRQDVITAWTDLAAARAALEATVEQLSAAETAFRGVTLERDVGLRTTFEILDQEQQLLNARLAVAESERALTVAQRRLLAAIGALAVPR